MGSSSGGLDERSRAGAAALLVRHDQEAQRAETGRARPAERGDRVHRGRDAALHVPDAGSMEPPGLLAERPGHRRADRPDGVRVAEQQDARTIPESQARVEDRPAACQRLDRHLAARSARGSRELVADGLDARGGVGWAVDRDESPAELDDRVEVVCDRRRVLRREHRAQRRRAGSGGMRAARHGAAPSKTSSVPVTWNASASADMWPASRCGSASRLDRSRSSARTRRGRRGLALHDREADRVAVAEVMPSGSRREPASARDTRACAPP